MGRKTRNLGRGAVDVPWNEGSNRSRNRLTLYKEETTPHMSVRDQRGWRSPREIYKESEEVDGRVNRRGEMCFSKGFLNRHQ